VNPRELLALLTCRVQRFHLAPGGIPNITAEDVAAALGMMKNDEARIYARIKYCGQTEYADELARAMRRYILFRKADDGWRIPRPGFILAMSYLILSEAVDPHTCSWCEGRAEVRPEHGPVIVCEACQGSGRRRMKNGDRARLMGVSKSSWSDPWGDRYREIQIETVDKWEDMCGSALGKRLSA